MIEAALRFAPPWRRTDTRMLSPREIQVLQLMAEGYSNRQIGLAMGITEATTKNHVNHVAMRLGALNRAHSVALGMARGLVELANLEEE